MIIGHVERSKAIILKKFILSPFYNCKNMVITCELREETSRRRGGFHMNIIINCSSVGEATLVENFWENET